MTNDKFCYIVKGSKEVQGKVQVPGDLGESGIIGVYKKGEMFHIGYVSDRKNVLVDATVWDKDKYKSVADLDDAKKLARSFRKEISDAALAVILND